MTDLQDDIPLTKIFHRLPAAARGLVLLLFLSISAVAQGAVQLPHVEVHTLELSNGLHAILAERHDSPVVTVEVWYHVGSKNEVPGKTGFAHLFEHLMFDGTSDVPADQFSNYIIGSGGIDNAYTNVDTTVFWETVPASALPMALWLEADRMRNLDINQRVFDNERQVVKEERRMRFDNQPYGDVIETLYAHAFRVHPYHHLAIGSMEDLDHASLPEVRTFYDTYYVPNNATVVVVGDCSIKDAEGLVKKYFGAIPRGAPIVRDIPREPPQTSERVVNLHQDVALPAFVEGFHMPADGTPDAYPLELASKILSQGESSIIYRKLVYEEQMALEAQSEGDFTEDPNLFFVFAVMNPGHTLAEGEKAVDSILNELKSHPVSREVLEKARNQVMSEYAEGLETSKSEAEELGYGAVVLKDANLINTEPLRFDSVTPEDIQRVAQTYFVPSNMTLVNVNPEKAGQTNSQDSGKGSGR